MGGIDDVLELRWSRYEDELTTTLHNVYREKTDALVERVHGIMAKTLKGRPADLCRLDETRLLRPDWLQQPGMTGYACHADRFAGTLNGILRHLDYLHDLGVTYLHLMPLLQPREGANDGGYVVAGYRSVRSDPETMDDLAGVAKGLRERGISLVVDLVLNHVAKEHEWAQCAWAGGQKYRDYFMIYPDRAVPGQYEQILPEVFPDFAPGNFTWDEELAGWMWTILNDYQWGVNWANPDVFREYLEIICNLTNHGVEVLRLDAIAFIWKQMGTDCQNEPPVHELAEALRATVRIAAPAAVLKAEATVGPRDLVAYFDQGCYYGKFSDLAHHSSLVAQLWSALASRDVALLRCALERFPAKPPTTTWGICVRCHDDIGWAVDDRDAAAVDINGAEHRRFLSDLYSGKFPKSFAHDLVFQASPATDDRRISGTLAFLAGLELALESKDQEAIDLAVGRINMLHVVIYGLGGVPLIYMDDELAILNDYHYGDDPTHAGDNRWMHRPVMDWDAVATLAGSPDSAQAHVNAWLRYTLGVRHITPRLHAGYKSHILDVGDRRVLVIRRDHPIGPVYQLYNLSEHRVSIPMGLLRTPYGSRAKELFDGVTWDPNPVTLSLESYQAHWFVTADDLEE